jgi:hypothetical protein
MTKALAAPMALAVGLAFLAGCTDTGGHNVVPASAPDAPDIQASKGASNNFASGRVVDENGKAVVGATVVISPTAYTGGTLPSGLKQMPPHGTTDGKGEFKVSGLVSAAMSYWSWAYIDKTIPDVPYPEWVEVFPRGDSRAPYHGFQTVRAGRANNLGTIVLVVLTKADLAEKTAMESDRATLGVPRVLTPLTFDSIQVAAGRRWSAYMATTGWFNHPCPPPHTGYAPCMSTWKWEIERHGMPSAENIDYGSSDWPVAEAAFMQERFNCPGRNWKRCTWAENTGHYINIMDDQDWVGLGVAFSKTGVPYYDQEFGGPAEYTSPSFAAYRDSLLHHPGWH